MNPRCNIIILSLILLGNLQAQVSRDAPLFKEIYSQDSIIFEDGFNRCKLESLRGVISNDFEFYHDVSGFNDKSQFLEAMMNNICNSLSKKPIRKLELERMEVFELKNNDTLYGAIQIGIHHFYMKELDKRFYQIGTARFTHLWILEADEWKLKRVLSYDHKAVSVETDHKKGK